MLPVAGQILQSPVTHVPIATSVLNSTQVRIDPFFPGHRTHIGLDYFSALTIHSDFTAIDPNAPATQMFHGRKIVRYEEYGSAASAKILHRTQALFLKCGVAHC